ncbi:acyl-CoA-binding domain-containing protein 4-like isoform X2 [Rhodamnia argentea]|uniref:Acyl-CoA-binding domain-containing protein 4-like isoform X2 n=1 Tax=Rhodamnia argentea TaxID=178133 RepID=A0A8B8QIV8_9MYRT|nr:acyl-CoA-binding domain-containing protein 4-like isoform X2 [Rhodamnia argentea]
MWCGGGESAKKKAMWLYPKVVGFNPPERWGHTACYSQGHLYIFGGCCGGLHFGDVLVLDLDNMAWRTLATTGQGPGPRDSHSAVLVGHRMVVFGGTNGSRKVNDLHVLDLRTKEWTQPNFRGRPPCPRESHSATLVGNDKMVIFGGSGQGEANYLNDLHVLDLETMRWMSPEVEGEIPVPRDSHSAVAMENKLVVYGGDCGNRYLGDVDVLDTDTMTWSKLTVQGFTPGVRAGHGAVSIGTKIYVLGGVGDKHYYNDIWVLDMVNHLWTRLGAHGQQPRGRFSHTAVALGTDISIYGGCGEDERPLNELLILQLEEKDSKSHQNNPLCSILPEQWNKKNRRRPRGTGSTNDTFYNGKDIFSRGISAAGAESKESARFCPDAFRLKRERTAYSRVLEVDSEQEEHSLSLSQHSSPSQSDQEQTQVFKATNSVGGSQEYHFLKNFNQIHSDGQPDGNVLSSPNTITIDNHGSPPDLVLGGQQVITRQEPSAHVAPNYQQGLHCRPEPRPEQTPNGSAPVQNMIGAEVRGKVDGAFDSGFLVTASVNGKIFRGVLFAPAPSFTFTSAVLTQNPPPRPTQIPLARPPQNSGHVETARHAQQVQGARLPPLQADRASPLLGKEPKQRSDLQGVVLTLGGPASGH